TRYPNLLASLVLHQLSHSPVTRPSGSFRGISHGFSAELALIRVDDSGDPARVSLRRPRLGFHLPMEDPRMRLTLRTLLAWLDDTLEPSQVREIGKQVSESPFAQELADRIHRVSRQRRLSVPSRSGPDGTDPNLVASYLDNNLDPEAVAEFERKCLTSDVNLAEVASVHQILSLLGQKVKVPTAARSRMNQLVKGRENIRPQGSAVKRPTAPEPVTQPIHPWVPQEIPKRPVRERFGPAGACILLIIISSWSAWKSLTEPSVDLAAASPELPGVAEGGAMAAGPVEKRTPGSALPKPATPAAKLASD